jgi:serine/threonine-protein kinase
VDEIREDRLERLFEEAAALPAEERGAFLEQVCGADLSLRSELESLLADTGEAEGFLDRVAGPALARAGEAFADPPEGTGKPEVDPLVGEDVGPFRVLERLGSGSMGVVYRASDTRLDRHVALKFLPLHLSADAKARARLKSEARAISALDHPNLAVVHEIGEHRGQLFIVMAFYQGETLKERLAHGALPVGKALDFVAQIAEGLQQAHEAGIVHRDVKPANVLVTDRDQVKLVDFGIAKVPGETLTQTGMTPGTVAYMSPEQARGEVVDRRTDLWSLGVVLQEMVVGERPFQGENTQAVLHAIQHDEPKPLRPLSPDTPEALAGVLKRLLQKDTEDRYQDVSELLADLRRLPEAAASRPGPSDRSGRAWRFEHAPMGGVNESTKTRLANSLRSAKAFAKAMSPTSGRWDTGAGFGPLDSAAGRGPSWKLALAAAGVALVAGASAVWILRPDPEIRRRPIQLLIESDSAHTVLPAVPALSPDGSLLAYPARTGSGSMLYLRRIDEVEARPIPGTEGADTPFFSPDGAQLGFRSGSTIQRVRLTGGTPRVITEFEGYLFGADWGDDDEIVFSTWEPGHVYVVNANGGTPEPLEALDRLADTIPTLFPAFIPGERAILFWQGWGQEARIGVGSLESGKVRLLMRGGKPRYARSGHLVYVRADGTLVEQPFDVARLDTAGPARRVVDGVGMQFGWLPMFAASSSGTLAYNLALERRDLVLVDREGNEQVLIPDRGFWAPRFSPDGTRIAFGVQTGNQQEDIWIHDLLAGTTSRVTLDGRTNNDPVWHPDGTSFAFSSVVGDVGRFETKDLFVISLEGGDVDRVVAQDGQQWTTDWSPDSRHLVFVSRGESLDIWVVPLSGDGEPRPFLATPFQETGGRVSPNGRWLAYTSDESGQVEVYLQAFPETGNKRLISIGGGRDPVWGPDGRELFYWNPEGQLIAHQLTTGDEVTVGLRRVLFQFLDALNADSPSGRDYDIHPDGRQFVRVKHEIWSRLIVGHDLLGAMP